MPSAGGNRGNNVGRLVAAGLFLAGAANVPAQDYTKIVAPDAAMYDGLGAAVSVSGTALGVGMPMDDSSIGSNTGAVYVYRSGTSGWGLEQKLIPADVAGDDRFGSAVAIDGSVLVAGSPNDSDLGAKAGSVYVFRKGASSWIAERKLTASDGASLDVFGSAVAVSGDTILVGASGRGSTSFMAGPGAAYVFRYNGSGWVQEARLTAADGASNDRFGYAVGLFGNVAVVGSYMDADFGSQSGSAYVFRRSGSTWVQEKKLTDPDRAPYVRFGYSVAIHNDLIAVGTVLDGDLGAYTGSAYLFRYVNSSWIFEAEVHGSDSLDKDWFGWSVALGKDALLVGSWNAGRTYYNLTDGPGAAYLFRKSGSSWVQDSKLVALDGATYDHLGTSVALEPSTGIAAAGSPGNTHNVYASGAVYLQAPQAGCTSNADCNDSNVCTNDVCNLTTGECANSNNTLTCNDNSACTTSDRCSNGVCSGTAVVCNDNKPCTDDTCNPSTGCVYTADNTNTCTDGNGCTTSDRCSSGVCVGTPLNCNDNNACTTDTCSNGLCQHTNNTSSCSDGNACTINDWCSNGACSGTAVVCNDNNPCTNDSCSNGVCQYLANTNACNDNNACTTGDRCSSGVCLGTPVVCNDNVACTIDSCVNGACQYNSSGCGCTSNADCNDGNVCTTDVCNTTTRTCSYTNNTLTCNDANGCTTSDRCSNGACAGVPISCNDGNPCTTDTCSNGACSFVNNTNPCNDNDACTSNDKCGSGVCRGTALVCSDGIACTTDYCLNGSCVFDAAACGCTINADCNDGDPCTTDQCSASHVCSHTLLANCCGNGTCETSEDSCSCADDCVGPPPAAACGNGVCEAGDGENCLTCPSDCNGVQNGSPGNRFCCGDGSMGSNPVTCADSRCTANNWDCQGASVVAECCGDAVCSGSENGCSCPQDCGSALVRESGENCTDGVDGDCDGLVDCLDSDCAGDAACWGCNRNGICQPGEDCKSCPSDCDGQTGGRRQDRFCCGNGVRELAEGNGTMCDSNY